MRFDKLGNGNHFSNLYKLFLQSTNVTYLTLDDTHNSFK